MQVRSELGARMQLDEGDERFPDEKCSRRSKELRSGCIGFLDRSCFVSDEIRIGGEIEQRAVTISLDLEQPLCFSSS